LEGLQMAGCVGMDSIYDRAALAQTYATGAGHLTGDLDRSARPLVRFLYGLPSPRHGSWWFWHCGHPGPGIALVNSTFLIGRWSPR